MRKHLAIASYLGGNCINCQFSITSFILSNFRLSCSLTGIGRSPNTVKAYAPTPAHDPLDLWTANVSDADVLASCSIADLGSIIDLNIIYSYSAMTAGRTNVILEIGGGYGRLAKAQCHGL
jgi:hypothetical protein